MRFLEKYQHLTPAEPGVMVDEFVLHLDLCGTAGEEPRDFVCSGRDRLGNNPEVIRTKKYCYFLNFLLHQSYTSFYLDGGFFSKVKAPEEGTPECDFWETSC